MPLILAALFVADGAGAGAGVEGRADADPAVAGRAARSCSTDWQGRVERDFEPEILEVLGVDDYANRSYYSPDGRRIGLYIGYHDSQRQGDTIHSPLNCLPGAGWMPITAGADQHRRDRSCGGGESRASRSTASSSRRGLDRQLVLYWYQSHGRVVASEYWGKVYTVVDAIRLNRTDAALVRVIAPVPSREAGRLAAAEKARVLVRAGAVSAAGAALAVVRPIQSASLNCEAHVESRQ